MSLLPRPLRTAAVGLVLAALAGSAPASPIPALRFEAPPEMANLAERLMATDRAPLGATATLLGLDDAGPPIRVVLAPENSPAARRAPRWAVAYAVSGASLVVLIPARVPSYPDRHLHDVLHHEIAHVLIGRAADHRPVPRWLNEGLAIYASREVRLADRTQLLYATLSRRRVSLRDLDAAFGRGPGAAGRAYALSAAFVRHLLDEAGPDTAARLLADVAAGLTFPDAFRRAVGRDLERAENDFFAGLDRWRWIPFLTGESLLWILITLLALLAFVRRRAIDREQRDRWDREEQVELAESTTDGWVH